MKYKIILPLLLLTVCLLIVIKQKYHVWMPQSYMKTIFPQDQSVSSATESSTNTTLDIYSERRQHVSEMCDKYKHDIGMTVTMLDVTYYCIALQNTSTGKCGTSKWRHLGRVWSAGRTSWTISNRKSRNMNLTTDYNFFLQGFLWCKVPKAASESWTSIFMNKW